VALASTPNNPTPPFGDFFDLEFGIWKSRPNTGCKALEGERKRGRLVPRVTRMQGAVIEMNDATCREQQKRKEANSGTTRQNAKSCAGSRCKGNKIRGLMRDAEEQALAEGTLQKPLTRRTNEVKN
jgi:hypothetical protein